MARGEGQGAASVVCEQSTHFCFGTGKKLECAASFHVIVLHFMRELLVVPPVITLSSDHW
jgi:hypothetical protein